MNYQNIFKEIDFELSKIKDTGLSASYIPELAKVNPNKLGIHLSTIMGGNFHYGDSQEKFSIQSISKVFSLTMAFKIKGADLWNRVDVEPSGDPFNSLVQLEFEKGIPRNPLINAGAIVISDILVSELDNPKKEYLQFIRKLTQNKNIQYNKAVAKSEKETGFRNYALINLMKEFGNIKNDIDLVLDFYFHLCAIEMNCQELSKAFLFLANNGVIPATNERILSTSRSKRINAIMQLCGFYDEAGEFSFKVGLPGKSGVGGGIIAILPNQYSIAVWSPRLNPKGNSFKGMKVLEMLTTKTENSIF